MRQLKHDWKPLALLGVTLLTAGSLNVAWGQFYAPEPIPFPDNFNPAQQPMPSENRAVIRQASLNGTTQATPAPKAAGVQHAQASKTNTAGSPNAPHASKFKAGAEIVGEKVWHAIWFQHAQKKFQRDDLAAHDSLRFKQQLIKSFGKDPQFKAQSDRLKAQIEQESQALYLKQEAVKAHQAELKQEALNTRQTGDKQQQP